MFQFSPKDFRAELCPFEVLKRKKKFVKATSPKLFDGIP